MMTLRLWHYCVSSEDEHPDDVSLGKTMMTMMVTRMTILTMCPLVMTMMMTMMVITMCTVQPVVMQVGLKFHD